MTDDNPFEGDEWEAFARNALEDLVPKLQGSMCTVSIVPRDTADVKFALELGFSVMLDKPIIAVIPPGRQVPSKLARIADEIVEGDPGDDDFNNRLRAAIDRVFAKVRES